MKDSVLNNYMEAGRLASIILREGAGMVRVDVSILEYVEGLEARVAEEGAALAFPLNVSINEAAAHDTASYGDQRVFARGDIVKIDLGVHIDGYIADTATTVDLGKNTALVDASREALNAAIKKVAPGAPAGDLGGAIQQEIVSRGYRPVSNLTGHGLGQYVQHRQPTIPNIAVSGGTVIEEGMVFAIEPFATTGSGHVREGARTEIFSRISDRPVRNPSARTVLEKINDRKALPFARRWLNERKLDLALPILVRSGHLHAYPVLSDVQGSLVSQHEHTVIVTEDGCIVTTR